MRRLMAAAILAGLFAVTSCQALRTEAGRGAVAGLDNAASRPVIEAIERQAPEVAATVRHDAETAQASGSPWPWMSSILANWEAIAAVLALGGGGAAWVARGKRLKQLIADHQWLKVASEAMSLGIEISTAKNVPIVDALKSAAKAKLGSDTIRAAMEKGGAETVRLPS